MREGERGIWYVNLTLSVCACICVSVCMHSRETVFVYVCVFWLPWMCGVFCPVECDKGFKQT